MSRPAQRANIQRPVFDEPRQQEGFRVQRARLGHALGTERLGISQWQLPPGEAAYPYHWHVTEEELLIVLEGRPSLRAPDGWRQLEQGEIISFPRGEVGAHQLVNRSDITVSFLALSTNGEADIVLYPDSDKVGVAERQPGGGGLRKFFRAGDEVDYWDGEEPPAEEAPGKEASANPGTPAGEAEEVAGQ